MSKPECPRCHEAIEPAHVKDFVKLDDGTVQTWHNHCRYEHQRDLVTLRMTAMRAALTDARSAIASLPADALGLAGAQIGFDEQQWPIRDELLAKIDKALNT